MLTNMLYPCVFECYSYILILVNACGTFYHVQYKCRCNVIAECVVPYLIENSHWIQLRNHPTSVSHLYKADSFSWPEAIRNILQCCYLWAGLGYIVRIWSWVSLIWKTGICFHSRFMEIYIDAFRPFKVWQICIMHILTVDSDSDSDKFYST